MKAFVLQKYGTPITEVHMPKPTLGDHEVLVQMSAAGINHADERVRAGEFKQIFPFVLPKVMGSEFSGTVVAVGAEVSNFKQGMRVFAYPDQAHMGAFAELIAVHQDYIALVPRSVSMLEAASLPVTGLTAWQGLVEMGNLEAGQTVLIHGGSGGVGTVAIQLAKHLGATVATTVSAANAEYVRELGADIVIDYRTEDFTEILSDVDLVLDSQGGDTLKRSLSVVRPGGLVIGISGPPDPAFADRVGVNLVVKQAIRGMSSATRRSARKTGATYRFLFIRPSGEHLRKISELVDSGVIKPVIDRVLSFERTPQALESLLSVGARGKVMVNVDPSN